MQGDHAERGTAVADQHDVPAVAAHREQQVGQRAVRRHDRQRPDQRRRRSAPGAAGPANPSTSLTCTKPEHPAGAPAAPPGSGTGRCGWPAPPARPARRPRRPWSPRDHGRSASPRGAVVQRQRAGDPGVLLGVEQALGARLGDQAGQLLGGEDGLDRVGRLDPPEPQDRPRRPTSSRAAAAWWPCRTPASAARATAPPAPGPASVRFFGTISPITVCRKTTMARASTNATGWTGVAGRPSASNGPSSRWARAGSAMRAQAERADRDAELRAGDHQRDLVHRAQRPAGPLLVAASGSIDRAPGGDQRELAADEERVAEQQQRPRPAAQSSASAPAARPRGPARSGAARPRPR